MTSSNHMLTGVVIATVVKNPLVAVPLAFLSHFICDALPHFGFKNQRGFNNALKHKITYIALAFDAVCWIIALYFAVSFGWIAVLAGVVAVSPDFQWLAWYIKYEIQNKIPRETPFSRFHKKIQWCERPWGLAVDGFWFLGLSTFLIRQVL